MFYQRSTADIWFHRRRGHFKDLLRYYNLIPQDVLEQFRQLWSTGWRLEEEAVVKSVQRLLGGSYEEFMAKELVDA